MKTLFELVKVVLDELYEEGTKAHGATLDAEIKSRIKELSNQYTQLTNPKAPKIDYSDPATRFAYVYKYVATHADYVYQILDGFRDHLGQSIFSDPNLRVTCIGGGPGSDLIGLLKYLGSGKEPVKKIMCYLCDGEQAWADNWTEVDEALTLETVAVSTYFQKLDVTTPATWASQRKFLDADLFTLSYFVSEVVRFDGAGLDEFWTTLFNRAKNGALFIFDDNSHNAFVDYFDNVWKKHGIRELDSNDKLSIIPSYDEQQRELGKYLTKFDAVPKLRSYISYRILVKE